MYSETQAGYRS